jgi:hypothetical protein
MGYNNYGEVPTTMFGVWTAGHEISTAAGRLARSAAVRRALTALGIAAAIVVWVVFIQAGGQPVDAWAYYQPTYGRTEFAFIYSPPVAQLMDVLNGLPFPVFTALIRGTELAALVILAGPATLFALFLPPVATEVNAANINLVLGVCIVGGFRWPILWVPVLLTKPTAGIGLAWFLWRRDWRALTLVLAVTGGACALSLVTAPGLWGAYIGQLGLMDPRPGWPFPYTLLERSVVFAPLLAWGVVTGRKWAVVLASILAFPRLYFLSISLLLALLPVLRSRLDDADEARRIVARPARSGVHAAGAR